MSAIRIIFKSVSVLANLRLILINLLLLPLISICFLLLLGQSGSSSDSTRLLIGTIICLTVSTSANIICSSFVYDQNISLTQDVLSIKPHHLTYWGPKYLVSTVIAGCELLLLGGLGQLLLTTPFLSRLIITSPLIFLTGILLGYLSAIAGWGQENPYWLLNILGTFLILLSGTIIPVEKYPPFLKYLAEIFPLNAIINEVLAVSYLDLSSIASFFFLILLAIIWTKLKVRYLIHH